MGSRQFTVDGQRFFITWPQSDQLTDFMILRHLKSIASIQYACVCTEKHVDQHEHHHAFVWFKNRIRRSFNCFNICECQCNVKKVKPGINSIRRTIKYVQKDQQFIEDGEIPEKITKAVDKRDKCFFALTHSAIECVDSGMFTMSDIIKLDTFKCSVLPKNSEWQKRTVYWLYGPTGSGKTRTAFEQLRDHYGEDNVWLSSGDLSQFFNGYHGQQGVLLDDMRPGMIKFNVLLRILDGYPVDVNIKGNCCSWRARTIFITAPCPPNEMYINRETGVEWDHLDQLLRRIEMTVRFPRTDADTEILWFQNEEIEDGLNLNLSN